MKGLEHTYKVYNPLHRVLGRLDLVAQLLEGLYDLLASRIVGVGCEGFDLRKEGLHLVLFFCLYGRKIDIIYEVCVYIVD